MPLLHLLTCRQHMHVASRTPCEACNHKLTTWHRAHPDCIAVIN